MQKNHAKRTALALFLLFAVTVSAQAAKIAEVIPIGHTVGIKMQAEGVLIVQLTEVQGESLSLIRRPFCLISAAQFPRASRVTSFPA